MKKLFILCLCVLLSSSVFAEERESIGLIVMGSSEKIEESELYYIEGQFKKQLIASKKFDVRISKDDDLFKERVKELKFQNSGAVDDDDIKDFGKFMGVDYLCVVTVKERTNDYYFEVTIFNIESGKIDYFTSYPDYIENDTPVTSLYNDTEVARAIGRMISRVNFLSGDSQKKFDDKLKGWETDIESDNKRINRNAALCSIIPGVGLMMKGHHWTGAAYLVGDAALLGGGAGMLVYANKQKDIFNSYNTSSTTKEIARRNYNTANTVSYCCFGAAAALYIGNIIHSYLATPDDDASPKFQYAIAPSYNKVICGSPDMGFEFALRYNF